MDGEADYREKLERTAAGTLLPRLPEVTATYLRRIAERYRFTFQELRFAAQTARDLEMWREEPLPRWWERTEQKIEGHGRERKKALLRALRERVDSLAASAKVYPAEPLRGQTARPIRLQEREAPEEIFGLCAAYSDHTVCCGLRTIDAVMGCAFRCSYCTVQTFYEDTAQVASDLAAKLDRIQLDPDRFYHIGTGQASDSLLWGNRLGLLDALCGFAERNPNVLLELKTKSDNVGPLLERTLPENIVCSWSLNTPTVITNEEHGTAALDARLKGARRLADRGQRVAFHFHPMVYYNNWREEYEQVADRLLEQFSPREAAFLSMGSMTFIRPVARQIRERGGESKVLQMAMANDPHGKLTYPNEVKVKLYRALYQRLAPWHTEVFFYLCMDTAEVWQQVFGRVYADNAEFESAFAAACG